MYTKTTFKTSPHSSKTSTAEQLLAKCVYSLTDVRSTPPGEKLVFTPDNIDEEYVATAKPWVADLSC